MSSKQSVYQHKWWIFLAMSVAVMMSNVELTAMNLALVSIAKDLHLTLHLMQWVINAFLLCNASLMVTGGKLADIFGRRRIFIFGVTIFVFASLLGGFAQNAPELILSRMLQGGSTAIGVTITTVIIYTAFPPEQRNMALGLLTGIIGFSLAIGPTLGGFLTDFLSWRWIFFINIPLGLLSILLTLLYTPKDTHEITKTPIDWSGIVTLSLGLAGLIFAVGQINQWHILSFAFLSIFCTSIALLIIFYFIEIKKQHPLITLDILHNNSFWLGCIVRMLIIYIIYVPLFIISLYMQNILNYTPAQAGIVMLAMTLTIGIFSPAGGWLTNRFGARSVLLIASILTFLTFLLFSRLTSKTHAIELCSLLFIAGFAYSLFSPSILRATMETVAEKKLSVASAIFYMMSVTGGALSVAIASAIMTRQSRAQLYSLADKNQMHLSQKLAAAIMKSLYSSHSGGLWGIHILHKFNPEITLLAAQSFMYAFSHIMLLGAFFALIAIAIVFANFKHAKI